MVWFTKISKKVFSNWHKKQFTCMKRDWSIINTRKCKFGLFIINNVHLMRQNGLGVKVATSRLVSCLFFIRYESIVPRLSEHQWSINDQPIERNRNLQDHNMDFFSKTIDVPTCSIWSPDVRSRSNDFCQYIILGGVSGSSASSLFSPKIPRPLRGGPRKIINRPSL